MSPDELRQERFGRATIFESGYVHGFQQFEVERIRFETATMYDSSTYSVAVLVRRGRRREERKPAVRIVVIAGWGWPALETDIVKQSTNAVIRTAKFSAFSPEWDSLLDEYLQALGPDAQMILDGRAIVPAGRRKTTARTRSAGAVAHADPSPPSSDFTEGAPAEVVLTRYERDPEARRLCIDHYGSACQVCGLKMGEAYGPVGEGFIHVHHRVPLSEIGDAYIVDPVRDLIPVCPNCHAMLHRGPAVLTIENLRQIVDERRR